MQSSKFYKTEKRVHFLFQSVPLQNSKIVNISHSSQSIKQFLFSRLTMNFHMLILLMHDGYSCDEEKHIVLERTSGNESAILLFCWRVEYWIQAKKSTPPSSWTLFWTISSNLHDLNNMGQLPHLVGMRRPLCVARLRDYTLDLTQVIDLRNDPLVIPLTIVVNYCFQHTKFYYIEFVWHGQIPKKLKWRIEVRGAC